MGQLTSAAKITPRRGVTKFKKRLPGGGMKAKYPEVEAKCAEWASDMNLEGIRVTGNNLRIKAKQFAEELNAEGFSGRCSVDDAVQATL